jgi:hypothetical protein
MGARCIGIRAVGPNMGACCIGIRAVEARCPIIWAVAVETAKTHGITQLRRMSFLQFITLWVSKKLNAPGFEKVSSMPHRKGNAVVTVPMGREVAIAAWRFFAFAQGLKLCVVDCVADNVRLY